MLLAKPWMVASGVALNDDGQPKNRSDPVPYVTSFIAAILVAGMMRHVFAFNSIDTVTKGAISGLGIGLFLVTPWIAIFLGFGGKPRTLTLIDGGYVIIGCTIIGAVLMLFKIKGL